MATSEIEKLERRYAENPHGLTFAPLAEVHRKNGDVARALELLTAGLELHPNYIPASIVLGRCHQDLGDLTSAEAAFAHVLRLDDENVIALKSLADINERSGHYELAENWLRRLVSVDRSNEEAREQLRRVESRQSEVAEAKADEKKSAEQPPGEAPASSPVLEMIDLPPEPAAPTAELEVPAPKLVPVDVAAPVSAHDEARPLAAEYEAREPAAALADTVSSAGVEPPAPEAPAAVEAPEPADREENIEPLPGLISAEFQPPLQATGGLGVETSEELVLEGSGNLEFRVPDASEDLKSVAARLSAGPSSSELERADAREAAPPTQEPPPKAPAELEFVLTETMAEVLIQQGHREEALRVYRELVRRNPGDARLELRLREAESAAARQQPAQGRSYLARDTNGQSVASFFHTLLAARPPSGPGSGNREVPSRAGAAGSMLPNQNGGALAGGQSEAGATVPPVTPTGDGSSAGEQNAGAVSFDDFFGSEPDESPQHGKSEPGGDDLDQFQSWLENLKR